MTTNEQLAEIIEQLKRLNLILVTINFKKIPKETLKQMLKILARDNEMDIKDLFE